VNGRLLDQGFDRLDYRRGEFDAVASGTQAVEYSHRKNSSARAINFEPHQGLSPCNLYPMVKVGAHVRGGPNVCEQAGITHLGSLSLPPPYHLRQLLQGPMDMRITPEICYEAVCLS
jgi:hypothetical protein